MVKVLSLSFFFSGIINVSAGRGIQGSYGDCFEDLSFILDVDGCFLGASTASHSQLWHKYKEKHLGESVVDLLLY
jgi:hypothetical protein